MMLEEIRNYLQNNGVTSVFMAQMPDAPDDVVCLYEYAGPPPDFAHDGQMWENPRLQAVTRSKTYSMARQAAQDVYNLLSGQANVTIGSHYLKIMALQSPFHLTVDANNRHKIAVNFDISKE